jgi:hypothetical protein
MRAAVKLQNLPDPAEADIPHIETNAKVIALMAELAKRKNRLAEAKQREKVAGARQKGQRPTASLADREEALLAGGSITATSPDAEKDAALEEQTVLEAGIQKLQEKLDALKGELSFELGKRLNPINQAAHVNVLYHAQGMHDSLQVKRVLYSRIQAAGYTLNETAMPRHDFPEGSKLGDPSHLTLSFAGQLRVWLQDRGWI